MGNQNTIYLNKEILAYVLRDITLAYQIEEPDILKVKSFLIRCINNRIDIMCLFTVPDERIIDDPTFQFLQRKRVLRS